MSVALDGNLIATERQLPYRIPPYYLPPDRWTRPTLTPARHTLQQPVLDLPISEGLKAELTWVVGYIPRWFTCLQTVTNPGSNHGYTVAITWVLGPGFIFRVSKAKWQCNDKYTPITEYVFLCFSWSIVGNVMYSHLVTQWSVITLTVTCKFAVFLLFQGRLLEKSTSALLWILQVLDCR